jgi:hypothetical protein
MRKMPINNFWLSKKSGYAAALKGRDYFNPVQQKTFRAFSGSSSTAIAALPPSKMNNLYMV